MATPQLVTHPTYTVIKKRSIVIDGQRTSISLEDRFWHGLRAIAYAERINTSALVSQINAKRGQIGLSSAGRPLVFFHLLARSPPSQAAPRAAAGGHPGVGPPRRATRPSR